MAFKRYFILLGLVLFAFILANTDLASVFLILQSANLVYLICSIFLIFLVLVLKAKKWQTILRLYTQSISLTSCFQFWCAGFFASILTPGRIGDFTRVLYIRSALPVFTGFLTVLVDRLMDISLLLIWAGISIVLFSLFFGKTIVSIGILFIFLIVFFFAIWFFSKSENLKRVFRPFFNFFVPAALKEKIKLNFTNFSQSVENLKKNKKILLISFGLGMLSWLLSIFAFYLILLALNISISFVFVLVIVPLIALADLLPVSISGLGTRDALLIFLFELYGLPSAQAVAVSLIYLVIGYIFPACLGFIFALKYPLNLKLLSEN